MIVRPNDEFESSKNVSGNNAIITQTKCDTSESIIKSHCQVITQLCNNDPKRKRKSVFITETIYGENNIQVNTADNCLGVEIGNNEGFYLIIF